MKVTLQLLLIILLSTAIFPLQKASAATDISGHPFEKEMTYLQEMGIMGGYPDGTFKPEKDVSRAEFAAFLGRSLQLPYGKQTFSDTVNHSLREEVGRAAAAGLIKGIGNNLFAPNRTITRQEMAVMIDRAVQLKGVKPDVASLSFIDASAIRYPLNVQHMLSLKIMYGFADNKFYPTQNVTRGHTAEAIYRMLKVIEESKKKPMQTEQEEAKNENNEETTTEVRDGTPSLVIAKKLLNIYDETMQKSLTYVAAGSEMKYIDQTSKGIKVEVSDITGFVKADEVNVVKDGEDDKRNYYKAEQGQLVHYLYTNGRYENYLYGPAPVFMRNGQKEYSFDGKTFSTGTAYQYFNYLPLRTKTSYTAEEIDEYIKNTQPASPLNGLGEVFKKVEEETGINALYLLAHAIHESAWGMSKIAREKFNLYGIRATDDNPLGNATTFTSFEDSIRFAANYVKSKYIIPGPRTFYHGGFLGNKNVGMNVFYASDPYWGQKIAGHMYRADRYLGAKDWNLYHLAINSVDSLNVRGVPEVGKDLLYEMPKQGMSMVVLDEIETADGLWYKILPDDPARQEAYVYANGNLGNYVQRINTLEIFAYGGSSNR